MKKISKIVISLLMLTLLSFSLVGCKQLDDLKGHSAQRQKTGKEVHHAGKER